MKGEEDNSAGTDATFLSVTHLDKASRRALAKVLAEYARVLPTRDDIMAQFPDFVTALGGMQTARSFLAARRASGDMTISAQRGKVIVTGSANHEGIQFWQGWRGNAIGEPIEIGGIGESNTDVDLGSGARDAPIIMLNAADIAALQDHDLKKLFQATAAEVKKRGLEDDANQQPHPEPTAPDEPAPVAAPEPAPSIDTAAAETTKPEKPRPQWKDYKGEMGLADFVPWAFAAERAAGTLCKATLRADKELYTDYFNWRRRPNLPPEQHWLRDLPKRQDVNERRFAEAGIDVAKIQVGDFDPETRQAVRLYNTATRRAQRARARIIKSL
jgi:hypothetical protein